MAEWQALCEGYQVDAPRVPHREGYKKGELARARASKAGRCRGLVCMCACVCLCGGRTSARFFGGRIERRKFCGDRFVIPPEPPIYTHIHRRRPGSHDGRPGGLPAERRGLLLRRRGLVVGVAMCFVFFGGGERMCVYGEGWAGDRRSGGIGMYECVYVTIGGGVTEGPTVAGRRARNRVHGDSIDAT